MKRLVIIFVLIFCFSCKKEKQDSPIFDTDDKTIVPKGSIVFHKNYKSLKTLSDSQIVLKYFKPNGLDSLFLISNLIKPNSFVADFNGDGEEDIVIFVEHVRNNKRGLIFFHSPIDFFIVGGGNENSVLDNIYYTNFSIDTSKIAYETVIDSVTGDIIEPNVIKLKNIALHMKETEGTSGLLTWNGESYIYIHTGD